LAGKFKLIFGSLLRTIHSLWLELTGAMFIAFAVMFGVYTVQAYRRYWADDGSSLLMLGSAAVLSLLTLAFGIHSFWKARKLR
jgi:uncharacterized membrane protein